VTRKEALHRIADWLFSAPLGINDENVQGKTVWVMFSTFAHFRDVVNETNLPLSLKEWKTNPPVQCRFFSIEDSMMSPLLDDTSPFAERWLALKGTRWLINFMDRDGCPVGYLSMLTVHHEENLSDEMRLLAEEASAYVEQKSADNEC
jgi:hypothetical protein